MKITKSQLKEIIKEELEAVLSEDKLEESNFLPLYLLRKMQKKRQKGPGASSVDTHKRALAAKEKTQAQRDMERREKEERERKDYDRRWRASLSPEDLAAEEEAEAFRQSMMEEELGEALEDRINPDLDDLEQAGFRPDPEEVGRMLAKKFPDLADGRVTQKIGKNDLMVFIAEEYDTSEQTAMQVVEEMIEEGIIGMMYPGFVNIITADFDEVNEGSDRIQKLEDIVMKGAMADRKDAAFKSALQKLTKMLKTGEYKKKQMDALKNRIRDAKRNKKRVNELKRVIREELEAVIDEKKKKKKKKKKRDACYHKVKARYDVWPSAYASGALVKCRKVGAANWGKSTTKEELELQEGDDALEPQIRKVLKDEGGAAGLDAIVKAVDADKAEVKATLKAMVDVGLHKNGDYILGDEAEVDIEKK